MAITRAQIARQLYKSGGDILGPLDEDDLTNQLNVGRIFSPGNLGRVAAFIMSGGATSAAEVAREIAKQKAMDKVMEESGNVLRPRIQTQLIQQDNKARGIGGYQSDFAQDKDFMGGSGTAAEMGSFAYGGRAGLAGGGMPYEGGIMDFESARQMYGLGKLVKKATRAVKKVAKSPIGKAALLYAGGTYLGGLKAFGGAGFGSGTFLSNLKSGQGIANLGGFFADKLLGPGTYKQGALERAGGLLSKFPGGGVGAAITATSLLPLLGIGTGDESEEEAQQILQTQGIDINKIRSDPYAAMGPAYRFYAEGGDVEPVAKKTMPLLNMDGMEKDYRAEGGFVPIGRMEKADDVPARLSKNEFVFTADAVRNAGDGDVDKGAEVMYNMMKNLEAGGEVSEESQGLEGARKMFQTSKRLEEVL
jgi:hypothetical protein